MKNTKVVCTMFGQKHIYRSLAEAQQETGISILEILKRIKGWNEPLKSGGSVYHKPRKGWYFLEDENTEK